MPSTNSEVLDVLKRIHVPEAGIMNLDEFVKWEANLNRETLQGQRDSWRELAVRYRGQVDTLEAERNAAWRRLLDLSKDERLMAAMKTIRELQGKVRELQRTTEAFEFKRARERRVKEHRATNG